MILKTVFCAFGFRYQRKRFKHPFNILRQGRQKGFKMWTCSHYPVVPFKLTDIGEGIKEVTVKQCHVKPHQQVRQFEDICDVESDKATVTITSRFDGLVKNIHFKDGDVIAVGSTLLDIEVVDDETVESANVDDQTVKTIADAARDNSSRKTTEVVDRIHVERRQKVADEQEQEETIVCLQRGEKSLATPAVRRIAKEYGVDVDSVTGTGKQGRVTKEDILVYLNQPRVDADRPATMATTTITPRPNTGDGAQPMTGGISGTSGTSGTGFSTSDTSDHSQPITAYRRVMFRTMTESNRIPTLTLSDEIDVTSVETLRKTLNGDLDRDKVKLTLLAFVVKAISLSLHRFPILNATLEYETSVKYVASHNIGIAVDTAAGLAVPNIKDVQRLSIRQIAAQVRRLQRSAQEGKLSLADTAGGTLTLSNIGSIAGTVVKPLILPPQVAIVGIGRLRQLPRFDQNDVVRKCSVINVSWAADHRVVDGATVARFSNSVKRYLENPGLLAVDA